MGSDSAVGGMCGGISYPSPFMAVAERRMKSRASRVGRRRRWGGGRVPHRHDEWARRSVDLARTGGGTVCRLVAHIYRTSAFERFERRSSSRSRAAPHRAHIDLKLNYCARRLHPLALAPAELAVCCDSGCVRATGRTRAEMNAAGRTTQQQQQPTNERNGSDGKN